MRCPLSPHLCIRAHKTQLCSRLGLTLPAMKFLVQAYNRLLGRLDPHKWYWWILILILFRAPIVYLQTYANIPVDACEQYRHDESDYICPVENFLTYGRWEPSLRLPGYSLIYLVFRTLLPMWYALLGIIILQVIVGCIASYLLSISIYNTTKSKHLFLLLFLLFGLNKYMIFYDGYVIADSLSQNFIAISIYLFSQYCLTEKRSYLFYSGLFLGWSAFMRPANVFAFPFGILALFLLRSKNFGRFIKNAFAYSIPYCVIITSFFAIYCLYTGEIYKLRYQGYLEHDYMKKILTIHGNICYPNTKIRIFLEIDLAKCGPHFYLFGIFVDGPEVKKGSGYYVLLSHPYKRYTGCLPIPPQDIVKEYLNSCKYTSKFTIDSLILVRDILVRMRYSDEKQFDSLMKILNKKLDIYIESVKEEYPIYFYFTSRIKALMHLVLGGQGITAGKSLIIRYVAFSVVILFHTLPLSLYLILFPIASLLCIRKKEQKFLGLLILTLSSISIVLSYTFASTPQVRYLASGYPYMLWGLAIEIYCIYKALFDKSPS